MGRPFVIIPPHRRRRRFAEQRVQYQFELLELRTLLAANLKVLDFDPPVVAQVGNDQQVQVSWRVQNVGDTAATIGWNDGLYFSDDTEFDPLDDQRIDYVIDPAELPLFPNEEYTINLTNVVIPPSASGSRFIILVADDQDVLDDPERSDNIVVRPILLSEPDVDLQVTDLQLNGLINTTPPYLAVAGEPFVVDYTVSSRPGLTLPERFAPTAYFGCGWHAAVLGGAWVVVFDE